MSGTGTVGDGFVLFASRNATSTNSPPSELIVTETRRSPASRNRSAATVLSLLALSVSGCTLVIEADEVDTSGTTIASTTSRPETSGTAVVVTDLPVAPDDTSPVAEGCPDAGVCDDQLALEVLARITVENEYRGGGYERVLFPHWIDTNGNGCSTRHDVLIRDSLTPAQIDPFRCTVVAGDWYSPFDGVTWTDPAEVSIDHVVALKEAWDSGAWAWDELRRAAFANDLDDPRTLMAVTSSVNESKGAADPSNWIPPNGEYVCTYLADWIAIKARWQLTMDQSEHGRIRNLLTDRCPEQTIEPWPPVEIRGIHGDPVPSGTGASGDEGCDPAYPTLCVPPPPPHFNCVDIPHRRFDVLPPDPHNLDGDNNGVGCEN